MRHLRSILYALVLSAAVWILSGVAFTHDLTGRARDNGGVETLGGLLLLLLAGAAYAILVLAPISPAGPAVAGLIFVAGSVWALAAPSSYAGVWPAGVAKDGFDVSLPGYGLAALLAVPMLATALSSRRWAGYEAPQLPLIGKRGSSRDAVTGAGIPVSAATEAAGGPGGVATRDTDPTEVITLPSDWAPVRAGTADGEPEDERTGRIIFIDVDEPTEIVGAASEQPTESVPSDEPTENVPSDEPTAAVPSDEPTATVPSDEPTATVPSDEPTAGVPSDEPTAGVPSDEPTTSVTSDEPTTSVTSDEPTTSVTPGEPTTTVTSEKPTAAGDQPDEPTAAVAAGEPAAGGGRADEATADVPAAEEELTADVAAAQGDQVTADVGQKAPDEVTETVAGHDVTGEPSASAAEPADGDSTAAGDEVTIVQALVSETPAEGDAVERTEDVADRTEDMAERTEDVAERTEDVADRTEEPTVATPAVEADEPVAEEPQAERGSEAAEDDIAASEPVAEAAAADAHPAEAEDETAEDETPEDETPEDETAEDETPDDETAEDETAEATQPMAVPVGGYTEDDTDKTQVIVLPVGERTTRDLRYRVRRTPFPAAEDGSLANGDPGERTQVIPVAHGEQTQVIRLPQQRTNQADGEQTQVIRAGTVDPPGDRTQVIKLPVQPLPGERSTVSREPERRPPSIVDAERPNPGDDPTTRISPLDPETLEEVTADVSASKRIMTVMNLERPMDEVADDTRRLFPPPLPKQRRPDDETT